ncbi:MAG: MFS transporter [Candidatus Lokiarchaeota archaeon]|nr:MFS transporter [Candidatus Lokiarchaeota archaeon]
METTKTKDSHKYSWGIMASYGSRELFGQWISGAFGFMVYFFYENVIGLDPFLAGTAFIAYTIWNAVNDPLMGYVMENAKVLPGQKKWGFRRFIPMIIGGPLWLASYLLIFLVPLDWNPADNVEQWYIFTWYVLSLFIYDTTLTLYEVNVMALYPDKFRGSNERRIAQMWGTILGIIGIVAAGIVPPMFVSNDNAGSFRSAAFISVGIGFILFLFIIPGIFEDKHLRSRYKHIEENYTRQQRSFFKMVGEVFSNRNFVGKIIFHFGYQVSALTLQASTFYIITFLLDLPLNFSTLMLAGMLVAAIVSIPIWTIISNKVNNNKNMSLAAGIIMFVSYFPMFFSTELWHWIASVCIFGVALGGQWFIDPPTLADVLDEVTVKTKRRDYSNYYGFQTFIIRFGGTFQALIFTVVHILTGYVASESRSELFWQTTGVTGNIMDFDIALLGIRLHSSLIPAGFILITIILFWILYRLKPEKVAENKRILKEMGM